MKTVLAVTERWLRAIAFASAALGGAVMLVMLAVGAANIVLRPFGGSVRGAVEISGYLCALAVGLCMPAAQVVGSHICAGLWASALPRLARRAQELTSSLICACLLFLVAKELMGIAEHAREMGEYIEGFDVSYYGMAIGFAFGIALHAAIFIHGALSAMFSAKEAA